MWKENTRLVRQFNMTNKKANKNPQAYLKQYNHLKHVGSVKCTHRYIVFMLSLNLPQYRKCPQLNEL